MQIEPNESVSEDAMNARRDALKKMAIFGAYTAPVMLGMLSAKKAVAASVGHGGGGGGGGSSGGACPGGKCTID
jgi:hypothetical protein